MKLFVALLLFSTFAIAKNGPLEISESCAVGGCFAGDAPGFPVTIANPGSYRLTGSLIDVSTANRPFIEITSSWVTLDLDGFSIIGRTICSGNVPSCGIANAQFQDAIVADAVDNLVIKNGIIRGMLGSGIQITNGQNIIISEVIVTNSFFHGVNLNSSTGINVMDSVITNNGDWGLLVGSDSGLLLNNSLINNGREGVLGGVCGNNNFNSNGDRFSPAGEEACIAMISGNVCAGAAC